VFAKNQPQYQALPTLVGGGDKGRVTSRWELTWRERWHIFRHGNLYIQQLTYGFPLQAILPSVEEPKPGDVL
jgi:hypothetical protein